MGYSGGTTIASGGDNSGDDYCYSVICNSVTVDAKSQPLLIGSVILTFGMVAPEGFMARELN